MIKIAKTLGELADSIVYLNLSCGDHRYPTEFQTYEEGWESLSESLKHLRNKIGQYLYIQLDEMIKQAKDHYDAEPQDEYQGFLGSWLMQDIERVIRGKRPFAYPSELYRWL